MESARRGPGVARSEGAGDDCAAAKGIEVLEEDEERELPLRRRFHILGEGCQNWFEIERVQGPLIIQDQTRIVSTL